MIRGKGRFGSRHDVEGDLEISAPRSNVDARLRAWIHESAVILPRLQTMVRNDGGGQCVDALLRALEDLGHRVARLEDELLRLGKERARA
jgi:hypothetical protein